MPDESSFADDFIRGITPEDESILEVVAALPPEEVNGLIQSGPAEGFQLILSRKTHREEREAIENNQFGYPMRVQGKNIFVTGSIRNFSNVSIDFNTYVKAESENAIAKVRAEREQEAEAERDRQEQAKDLAQVARDMKFK